MLLAGLPWCAWGQGPAGEGLPDAPEPQGLVGVGSFGPPAERLEDVALSGQSTQGPGSAFPPAAPIPRGQPSGSPLQNPGLPGMHANCLAGMSLTEPVAMTCAPRFNPYQRFLNSTGPMPLTGRQKGALAIRNVTDPFNFLTIAAVSALSVASDAHSPYGPGVGGFGRNFGVAYTETMVGSFFGTFLIPTIAHQDPHYHRMPNASIQRRVLHTVTEVVWGQSDAGTGMINYANLGTTAIGDALGNLYVPGRQQGWGPGISRFATALATNPIDNLVTEFLPDVARRVNVRIVLIQRVVNEVERQNGGT